MEKDNKTDKTAESFDVSWELDSVIMQGTFVKPAGPGPFPAVAMVAGSGPTDRDWNSPLLPGTNGSARPLAEALAQAGIASLRYDKRASGPHVRQNVQSLVGKMTMQSFADELAGAVRVLASRAGVRKDRIFGLGNSEGTLHVLNYQLRSPEIPFAGIVLAAPPGRAVGAVARTQLAEQASRLPNGDASMALYDEAIARWMAGKPAAPDPSLPQGVQQLLQSLEVPANLPFARELWTANVAPLLSRVDVPVLVVIGKKDIQVDWQIDGEPIERAVAGRDNVVFRFPENANHVLKHEPAPRAELVTADVLGRYSAPDARLDPEAVKDILGWLAERTS